MASEPVPRHSNNEICGSHVANQLVQCPRIRKSKAQYKFQKDIVDKASANQLKTLFQLHRSLLFLTTASFYHYSHYFTIYSLPQQIIRTLLVVKIFCVAIIKQKQNICNPSSYLYIMQSKAQIQSNTPKLPGNCTPIGNSVSFMMA